MKFLARVLSPVVAIFLLCLSLPTKNIYAIDGYIRFTNPKGGETLNVGQSYTITWESSSNIDKVNIGYKSCPSCLDWVVFTTPNTGSYTWNVNVGNTTNTQFYLQITGYETGKGSLTSNSGTFTVLGGSSNPTNANSNSTTTQSNTSSTRSRTLSPIIRRLTPSPTNTPSPTPTPIPLTLSTIHLSSTFIFDGSETTDITKIEDPKHVKNFTLETKYHWIITFTEELDLTDKKKLAMLRDADKYWVVEWWFVWIRIEWWEVFNVPCEVTVKNDQLTGYKPTVILSEQKTTTNGSTASATPSKLQTTTFKQGKPGEIILGIQDGGKILIKPNVQFIHKPENPVNQDHIQLTSATSHKNLSYSLMVNGKESSISAAIKDDGTFPILIPKLIEGANYIELSFKEASDSGYTKADAVTIIYKPKNYWLLITIFIFTTISLCCLGIILYIKEKSLQMALKKWESAMKKRIQNS